MKPDVNKVLQKLSQETSDKVELNQVLVEMASDTATLIKEIDSAADNISENRQQVKNEPRQYQCGSYL